MGTQFRGSDAMLLAQQQMQERERLRLERLRAAAQIQAMSAPMPVGRAHDATVHWVDGTAYGKAHAAGASHRSADRPAHGPDGAPNRLNLTEEQLAAAARAEEASRRSLPYLAAPPLAGAVIAGGLLGAPVAYAAAGAAVRAGSAQAAPVLRAGAAQVNKALAEANLRAAHEAMRRLARPGYDVLPSQKHGGYRYVPRSQTPNGNPDELVRLMPGNAKSPYPAQQRLYVKQNLAGGRVLDRSGQVIRQTPQTPSPKKAPEAHIPAWGWLRKEILTGRPTRPANNSGGGRSGT